MTAPDLSALVSARLCHDLISPMGAIGNGLELLSLSSNAGSEELTLISDSLGNALAKLRFFRIAFGPADPDSQLSVDEAAEITSAMYNGRFTVNWEIGIGNMPRPTGRLLFLAILCLEKSLPMGGLVRVSMAEDTISLAVEGRRVAAPPELWAHVTEGTPLPNLRADNVQFALLRDALAATRHAVAARFDGDAVELRLTLPAPLPA
jgi:histidine phosphotransferase ChpT